jgi:hypothetical protein
MSGSSVTHSQFVVERRFRQSAATVFAGEFALKWTARPSAKRTIAASCAQDGCTAEK